MYSKETYEQICTEVSHYLNKDMTVLKLACCNGQLSFRLAKKAKHWEATDFSENMIAEAKQNRKVLYLNLLTSGKLNGHLADLDKQAEEMFSQLVKQMAESERVTEQLKAENQMKWVARMNNIRSNATEIVNNDLIS